MATEVVVAVPRFKAAAGVIVSAPELVDQVDAAPHVIVSAPLDVVRLDPAFPVKVSARPVMSTTVPLSVIAESPSVVAAVHFGKVFVVPLPPTLPVPVAMSA